MFCKKKKTETVQYPALVWYIVNKVMMKPQSTYLKGAEPANDFDISAWGDWRILQATFL